MLYAGIIIFIIGLLLIYFGKRKKETQGRLAKTKSVPIGELTEGQPVEVQGNVVCDNPLKTPFSKRECVYYKYDLEKEVEERNKEGRITRRWEKVRSDDESIPFYVQDNTGKVRILPEEAEIEGEPQGEQFIGRGDSLDDSILGKIFNIVSNDNYRVKEKAILTGSQIYIYGFATKTNEGLAIQKGEDDFLISYKTEEQVEKSMGRSAALMKGLGILGIIGGIVLTVYSFFA